MRFRHIPLSVRMPLIGASMMVLVGIIASQQVLSALATVQENRLREVTRLHVEALAFALGPSVLRRDIWEIFDTLDRAHATAGQRMVLTVVADEAGRVLAASDPRRAPVDSELGPLISDGQVLEEVSLIGSDRHVRIVEKLVFQGRPVGQILTELNVEDLVLERRKALALLLIGNTLVTGALAFGGYLAMRRMLKPLATLSAHMSATEGRPVAIPAERIPAGDTELARLFQTYNAMAASSIAKVEAERRLAERERFVSLGRLSSSLAHEINNPLGGLLNATDTILAYADRADVVRDAASLLDRGLRHLRDVTRVTLEQNRLDRDGAALTREDFDDLKILFTPETARRAQRLDWPDIPARNLELWEAATVRQIVLNLLLNAAAAAGEAGTVGFDVRVEDRLMHLVISDDGPGLPLSAMTRLLSDDPLPPGGGMGLRLVRDLARGTGGHVEYRRVQALSHIHVTLPCKGGSPC
ncbi:MAG: zraS [Cereibacter sp.]|jgi:signal transduction histidine kinase|nr:zraS [Cereibacter sp.]